MRILPVLLISLSLLISGTASARNDCRPVSDPAASVDARGPDDASVAPAPDAAIDDTVGDAEVEQKCRVSRGRNECAVVTKQLSHFNYVLGMAQERDNELWENATLAHIDRLEKRRDRFCPAQPSALAQAADVLSRAAVLAAQAAAKAFTLGAL